MHKYSFIIIHLKLWVVYCQKFKTMINHTLLNIYEHYYSGACINVTEDDKMNETKNNER